MLGTSLCKIVQAWSRKAVKNFFYPLLAFAVFISVSAVSAFFIFPKPVNDWLPSMYQFVPIFSFYFLYLFNINVREIIFGMILVSVIISFLLVMDAFFKFEFFDAYIRRSSFFDLQTRRVVILKNELIFGFVALVSIYINGSLKPLKKRFVLCLAVFVFLVQSFVIESRMGFMAMGMSVLVLMYIKGFDKKIMVLSIFGLLVVFFAFPVIFSSHIEELKHMSLYDSESNISIRIETVKHFYQLYKESYGFGVGQMSSSAGINNVLNYNDEFNIVDAGFYSSLFQFGPVGLFIWAYFTIKCVKVFRSHYRSSLNSDFSSSTGFAFLVGFTISLLPISFFTASWCVALGGILLYQMWFFQHENWNRQVEQNTFYLCK